MRTATTTLIATLLGLGTAAAAPVPGKAPPMQTFQDAKPLKGWTVFCEGPGKGECALDTAQPERIALTAAAWKEIEAVNARVNGSIRNVTDQEHWGEPDVWGLAEDGKGDVEDYALVKRRQLVGKGLPRRAMRMTIVINEKGEGHAVLAVLTDRGDLILDSTTDKVEHWHRTGYVFIKRERQDRLGWVSLGGATGPNSYVEGAKRDEPKPDVKNAPKP